MQPQEETSRREDCQHCTEGPADETETDRLGEETGEVAVLEAHPP